MSDGIIAQYPKKYARVVAHRANDQHGGADMNIVTEKQCSKCGEWKDKSEFSKNKALKDGLMRWCRACNYAQTYAWQKDNKERYNANRRRRENETYTTEKRHAKHLKKNFGMTPEQYQAMYDSQDGKCAICGKEETVLSTSPASKPKKLSVDHNHKNGAVRGLLCTKCNAAIGGLNDDVGLLEKAIQYLKGWSK